MLSGRALIEMGEGTVEFSISTWRQLMPPAPSTERARLLHQDRFLIRASSDRLPELARP